MAYRRKLIVTFLLVHFACLTYSAEEQNDNAGAMGVGNNAVETEIDAVNYLSGFGWNDNSGTASELIDFSQTLANFQRYTGLPETGVFDEATKAKMNSPRCGNPDFIGTGYQVDATRTKRFTTLGTSWPQNEITWYYEDAALQRDLSAEVVRREIAAAFRFWADASALSFREVTTRTASDDEPDILASFRVRAHGDSNNFDGPGGILAHAFSPGRGRGGDMHFDDEEEFTDGRGTNLQQVAVHEIGHALGLGHSSDNNAIMAPFYQYREPVNFRLGQDDINGIRSLYGPPTNTATRPTAPTTVPTQPTMTTMTPPRTLPPFNCNGQFDAAVESFDGLIYLFQGGEVYKIRNSDQARIEPGYPRAISVEFPGAGIPDFVDAALLWTLDEKNKYMYIFKGNLYWRIYFDGRQHTASAGYPRSISIWGLPGSIDGAFRWPGNQRIYFFKGNKYYRYNTISYRIDSGYPRPLSVWNNVIWPIAAVLDHAGQSYFFNGQYFQTFSTRTFSASPNFQSARTWLGCQTEGLREYNDTATTVAMTTSGVEPGMLPPSIYVIILTAFLGAFIHLST